VSPVALVLAVLSFGLSATLAVIKVWETFVARSKFSPNFEWFDDESDTELRLGFTIANIGRKPDSIRSFVVRIEDGEISVPPCSARLPILLQPGEISPRFDEAVGTDLEWEPHISMFHGKAELLVFNSVGRVETFPIPNPYDIGILGSDLPPGRNLRS
jgi:hypothetical protein